MREVRDEVSEMHDYLQVRRTEQIQAETKSQREQMDLQTKRISLIGLLIGVSTIVFGILSINIHGITTIDDGLMWWEAAAFIVCGWAVLGFIGYFILNRGLTRTDRSKNLPDDN